MTIRIQICNERFLTTFGVDRILLLAAKDFRSRGIEVSLVCLRHNPSLTNGIPVTRIDVPPGSDMQKTERAASTAVLRSWLDDKPDIIIIGGWPFFDLAARAASFGVRSCFIDAGAVPHDELDDDQLPSQLELRRIRRATLPSIDSILPISEFIRRTQTIPDRCKSEGVATVLLGSDHLGRGDSGGLPPRPGLQMLCLGRFEGRGYKNSRKVLDVQAAMHEKVPLLVLGDGSAVTCATGRVSALGFPSDDELVKVMAESALGLSMSLWEGFNLPLVEMQELRRPVLAFNIGAHPEVTAHPWLLCHSVADMARKADLIVAGKMPSEVERAVERFPGSMPWTGTLQKWFEASIKLIETPFKPVGRRCILIDVTNSIRDPGNSGVIRVARQLSRRLTRRNDCEVILVEWDQTHHTYRVPQHQGHLASFGGPQSYLTKIVPGVNPGWELTTLIDARDPRCALLPILFVPEVVLDYSLDQRIAWARANGFAVSAICHDMIPIYFPGFCAPSVVEAFRPYAKSLLTVDHLICNSETTRQYLLKFVADQEGQLRGDVSVHWLPAEFGDRDRITRSTFDETGPIRILCVSTLEPRKNHARLLKAIALVSERWPDLRFEVTLVGSRYPDSESIVAEVEQARLQGLPVIWKSTLSDVALADELRRAKFTIYPSLFEGFGLPIVESLWMGKPCICSEDGVMAELAARGGCLTVDVKDENAIAEAIHRLASDNKLYDNLVNQACSRGLQSWSTFADGIADDLLALANPWARTGIAERDPRHQ